MFIQLLQEWQGKPAGEQLDVPDEYGPLLIEQKVAQPAPTRADPWSLGRWNRRPANSHKASTASSTSR